jgi:predicted esterase
VIPVEFGRAARDALEGDGLSLTYRETDFPHAIDPGLIPEIEAWLEAALSRD